MIQKAAVWATATVQPKITLTGKQHISLSSFITNCGKNKKTPSPSFLLYGLVRALIND